MNVKLKRVNLRKEAGALSRMDKKIFKSDAFMIDGWTGMHCYWLILNGHRVGSIALKLNRNEHSKYQDGSLYVASTGILPRYQGCGLGLFLKGWQIAYAHTHEFKRLVAHCRKSNRRIIALNKKFGFCIIGRQKGYYENPPESAVVMELKLN